MPAFVIGNFNDPDEALERRNKILGVDQLMMVVIIIGRSGDTSFITGSKEEIWEAHQGKKSVYKAFVVAAGHNSGLINLKND